MTPPMTTSFGLLELCSVLAGVVVVVVFLAALVLVLAPPFDELSPVVLVPLLSTRLWFLYVLPAPAATAPPPRHPPR